MTSIVRVSDQQIQDSYDGFELYFDKEDKILYSSINALARWLECNAQTIKNECVKLGVGKDVQTHTGQRVQRVKILTSAEVVSILWSIAESSRVKPKTKDNAKSRLNLLATLGNELGGMLAVAPEELAKIAISRTTTIEQADAVQTHLGQHQKYLKEYHGLHDELKARGAEGVHHAVVNKHNNELTGIRKGARDYMTDRQKDQLTLVQLIEKMHLEDSNVKTPWQAVNVCKQAGNLAKSSLGGILGNA